MGNEKIEKMLYEAQEKLPTTDMEWRITNMIENKAVIRKTHLSRTLAACIAFVLFFGIGGMTVLANMEMNIDSGRYSQWVDMRTGGNWKNLEKFMTKSGFVLPDAFGNYRFDNYRTLLVAKKGDTYWDALTKNVYNPVDIEYDDIQSKQYDDMGYSENVAGDDGQWINISIGVLDEAYWSAYYEFENVNGTWMYAESETVFEYGGMVVYGREKSRESGKDMNWRWVDEKTGVCWCVYVPVNKGVDSVEVVKEIIDINK